MEFWSLGGLENFYNLLQDSETPNLPVAEAIIKVILIYIPVRSAGGGLTYKVMVILATKITKIAKVLWGMASQSQHRHAKKQQYAAGRFGDWKLPNDWGYP